MSFPFIRILHARLLATALKVSALASWLATATSPARFISSGGKVESRLRKRCAAAHFSRCPAATKVWVVFISRQCRRENLQSLAADKGLMKFSGRGDLGGCATRITCQN